MTAHDIIGGTVWVQSLVLLAAVGFGVFELIFAAMGGRRHFQTRRRLSLVACASVCLVLAVLPAITPWAAAFNVTDAVLAQYLKGNIGLMTATEMQTIVEMPLTLVDDLARGGSWAALGIIALFGGAALARIAYLSVNVLRIRAAIAAGCVLKTRRRVRIVASPAVTVPFSTRGLFRYVVVLPADVCHDPAAMQMYLGHEFQHIRQGDVDAEILLSLVSPLLVLNPGFWFVAGRVRNLSELACDRAYLARERMAAREYSLRLLGIARGHIAAGSSAPRAFGVPLIGRSLPWLARRNMLKARIEAIAADVHGMQPHEGRLLALGTSLGLTGLILAGAIGFGASGDWSHERIMLSTVVNLERIDALNTLAQRSW